MASTGSLLLNRKIAEFSKSFAEQHKDDPELFSLLEKVVPDEVQRLNAWAKTVIEERNLSHAVEYIDDDGEKLTLGGQANLLLTGYDALQQRIRTIYWGNCGDACCQGKDATDLTPHDCADKIWAMGYPKAVALVLEKLDLTDCSSPLDVEGNVKNLIQQAAEAFPKWVGGTIYSHVIMIPELKEIYEEIENETHETLVAN